ncbi:nitrate- and nitrite sensing domain-containing protein [Kutzneria sp. 744]|uniref:sensor histidine kinase n=1 Tax=Kutzneria sp. (strain 744) TaxID=345341 RepID=UPI0003EEB397|nr:nitrate- and nitrite sensing domain-containing protein [Kutzneria sp. 744]EWM19819.1 histidine kinase [Kutzneria sp. 744]
MNNHDNHDNHHDRHESERPGSGASTRRRRRARPTSTSKWSIKARLTGVVLIPSIALMVLWTVAAATQVFDAYYVKAVVTGVREVSIPAVTALASTQKEREQATAFLGGGSAEDLTRLHDQEHKTDAYLASMAAAAQQLAANAPAPVAQGLQKLNDSLGQLPTIRSQIDNHAIGATQVFDFYNTMLDSAWSLFDTQARVLPDVTVALRGVTTAGLFRAVDQLSRSATLISGGFPAGTFDSPTHLTYANLVASYHTALTTTIPLLQPDIQARFSALTSSADWKALVEDENTFIEHGAWTKGTAGLPVKQATWRDLTNGIFDQLVALTIDQANEVSGQAIDDAYSQLTLALIGSIVALAVVVGTIAAAFWIARRSVVNPLLSLRDAVRHSQDRMHDIMRRLRLGEEVDVRAELPDLDHGQDEIGQVIEAFNTAQHAAASAAATEARAHVAETEARVAETHARVAETHAREGVSKVFLAIAHRNQGLAHRALKILDTMERGEENPQQLEKLFDLDSLATRERRNAENLIILAGGMPGRRWRKPVKLIDVLRAAVSETELYHRIQVEPTPDVALLGTVVADTIHLFAELADNATNFSPPRSQVLISSKTVAHGVVVEVEDQGLGMSEEDLDRANRMMIESPDFDAMALTTDVRLGLFVIARLASKLEINVEFRRSPYGGTRVIVLIPRANLAPDSAPAEPAASPDSEAAAGDADWFTTEEDPLWVLHRAAGQRAWPALESSTSGSLPAAASPRQNHHGAPPPATVSWPSTDLVPLPPAPPLDAPAPTAGSANGIRPVLPQRHPQHSLAPQLRGDLYDEPDLDPDSGRSPEEIRRTMSAFQYGSLQGRQAGAPTGSSPQEEGSQD